MKLAIQSESIEVSLVRVDGYAPWLGGWERRIRLIEQGREPETKTD